MKSHILLIDDSETTQAAISSILADNGYIVTTALNGTEGLSSLQQQEYDLILLDYGLPDTDGISLLSQILKEKPELPVIMVTGSGSERIAVNALKSGASDYVVKSDDFISKLPHIIRDNLEKYEMRRRNRDLEGQLRESYKQLKHLNAELEEKVQARTEELERAYQLSNELMAKAVDSNMQLAELYSEVDESRRKLDAKIRELSLLNDIGKTMASTLDQDTLLQVAIDSVHQELEVEHCAILLLNKESQHFHIGASRGTPDDLLLAAKSIDGAQILLESIRKGESLLIQDVEAHEQFSKLCDDYLGLECLILVPLRVKRFDIGILTVYGYEDRETLSQDEFEFVSSLAAQTSIALANIHVTNQRIREEQLEMLEKSTRYLLQHLTTSLELIRTCANGIEQETYDALEQKGAAQTIIHEVSRITGITRELLEFSRGQRGNLNLQTLSLEELMQDVLTTLESGFGEQKITIETNLEYTGPLTVDVDKMKQVFKQIADNARQAMPEGGTLAISSCSANDTIELTFADEGGGMPPEMQAHMFDPFVSDEQSKEAGLGMTIVKKILDEHQARIEVQSVLAKGTTIRVLLPRIQAVHADGQDVVKVAMN